LRGNILKSLSRWHGTIVISLWPIPYPYEGGRKKGAFGDSYGPQMTAL
jgi:hypothetical protein